MKKSYDPSRRGSPSTLQTNLIVAVVAALVTFATTRVMEAYKSQTAWSVEIARQQMAAARQLLEAAYHLREKQTQLSADARSDPSNAMAVRVGLAARTAASHELLAAYKYSRSLFPDETLDGFRAFDEQILVTPYAPTPLAQNDMWSLDATLDNASAALTRFIVESNMTATDRDVRGFFGGLLARAEPCPAESVTTGSAISVDSRMARVSGRSSLRGQQTWFDFDASPRLAYSLAAQRGVGVATNLQPATTYYYRYVVAGPAGVCRGATEQFTTPKH